MIDKSAGPGSGEYVQDPSIAALEVEIVPENEEVIVEEIIRPPAHDDNLALFLDDQTLSRIAGECKELYDADLQSRAEWERAYTDGLDLLGIKISDRSFPFEGSCGVNHPMILESAVRFQSKISTRLFPAKGPCRIRVFGTQTEQKLQVARRVEEDMNYYATERMSEYFPETEMMFFSLPITGSAFRKVYWDSTLGRPTACFVPATDFVMPAGFPNLETCPRYSQRMPKSHSQAARLMAQGYWREIDLDAVTTEQSPPEQKESRITGTRPNEPHSELLTMIEMHLDSSDFLELEGEIDGPPLPYVITWEYSRNEIVSIRRNWLESDPLRRKLLHYVHYRYVPGLYSYGLGLIHLIGGLAKASSSILRQLVDAGTLANLQGGLKARTLRIKGEDKPIAPGEWRDCDVATPKISDSLYSIPYKEPSSVLLQLYNSLVAEGKNFASIADLDLGGASANAPVGTILALIERASEVITAVQARTHASFKQELELLHGCIRTYDSDAYDYDVEGAARSVKQSDYAQRLSIRPVSDPSSATTAQRVMQLQAAMTFSQQSPQIYDVPKLHRAMLSTLGVDPAEELVPEEETPPLDPVSENMALVNSKPVKAYEYQDHDAHLQVHLNFQNDPAMTEPMSQSPMANSIQGALMAHVAEHLAFKHRKDIEAQLGVPLPPMGEQLPPEVEAEIARLEAQASTKSQQASAAKANQAKQEEMAQDPVFQLEQQRVQLEGERAKAQVAEAQGKLQVEGAKLQQKQQEAMLRTQAQAQQTAAAEQTKRMKIAADSQLAAQKLALEQQKLRADLDEMRQQLQIAMAQLGEKKAERVTAIDETSSREQIAAAEIAAERVRQQREEAAERERQARQIEADREAQLREIAAEGERQRKELDAERERQLKELALEQQRITAEKQRQQQGGEAKDGGAK